MSTEDHLNRYGIIEQKNPREIVLLRGSGCRWRRCRFCDYHLDYSTDEAANFALNRVVLTQVTGKYHRLEVINSGSFADLDVQTMEQILAVCREKSIRQIHFESHWMHRQEIPALRRRFEEAGIQVRLKIGVETFDLAYREEVLCKGIDAVDAAEIARHFQEACLLFGLTGQTPESMKRDIETGLAHFERICINQMVENGTKIKPDPEVIRQFTEQLYPLYADNPRVDILLHNTDFGVGGEKDAE